MKTLATIIATVAVTLSIQFLIYKAFSISDTPAYWNHVVLEEDVVLKYGEEVVGALKAGTTIHSPCNHDTAYTEPFDPQTYKVYVEFSSDLKTTPRSDFYDDGGHAMNVLWLASSDPPKTQGEQGAAGQPATSP